ncbi:MAG: coenzyme F420-0:L-glutamate ligase [Gammaproteobacteria bacterium]|nr:coenzyme F420-0:L-glutamate ligase [Gammaproteobacteria bacterium]
MTLLPLRGMPLVEKGDDLVAHIVQGCAVNAIQLRDADVVVVAQKIVSKSEGRQVWLESVVPSNAALSLAEQTDKDPRLVELILQESSEVVRSKPGVLITRHRLGHVGANAGVDQSNIDQSRGESVLLLPIDPDASANRIFQSLRSITNRNIGVVISDSSNRPWRLGTIGVAIGAANIRVLDDRRGLQDLFGNDLKVTLINLADSIATAASLLMGETTEQVPAVIVRGLTNPIGSDKASMANRPIEEDLFR